MKNRTTKSVWTAKFAALCLDEWPSLLKREIILITMDEVGLEFPTLTKVLANPQPICPAFLLDIANWILSNRHRSLPSLTMYHPVLWLFLLCVAASYGPASTNIVGIMPKQWLPFNGYNILLGSLLGLVVRMSTPIDNGLHDAMMVSSSYSYA